MAIRYNEWLTELNELWDSIYLEPLHFDGSTLAYFYSKNMTADEILEYYFANQLEKS